MTALWTGEALAAATGGELTSGCAEAEVSAVAIDTRTLVPGALFVALKGAHGDGHAHVAEAFSRGAAAALVHDDVPDAAGRCLVRVPDTLTALHALGRAGRDRSQARVVAVTGSVGKTTTKEMLRAALAGSGAVHAAEASYNNHWGVPLTLARLPADAAFCVAEIGMNHPGEIAPLASLVRPHVAIVTTIGTSHLGHMGSIDAIAREKAAIFASLEPGGAAVIPAESLHAALLRASVPAGRRVIVFGRAPGLEARLLGRDGTKIRAEILGKRIAFTLGAPGTHMAVNAIATLAACAAIGVDLEEAAASLAAFRPGAGRGETVPILGGAATLLDESYNASGASMRAAFEVLALLPAQRRIAVLGDMLELGEFAEGEHRALAAPAAEAADLVFACGPCSEALFDALPPSRRGAWAEDSAALAPLIAAAIRPGDAVLVKGSLGSKMRRVVDTLRALDHTS